MSRGNLRTPALAVEAAETLVEREPHLLGVPAAGHPRRRRLTTQDLHAEALEAERARARADRVVRTFGAKAVTCLTRTAGRAERRLSAGAGLRTWRVVAIWRQLRQESELVRNVCLDVMKSLRHVRLLR